MTYPYRSAVSPSKVVRAENDFERAAATDQMREAFRTAAAGMHSRPDFRLAQLRVPARREAHVAGEDELAAHTDAEQTEPAVSCDVRQLSQDCRARRTIGARLNANRAQEDRNAILEHCI